MPRFAPESLSSPCVVLPPMLQRILQLVFAMLLVCAPQLVTAQTGFATLSGTVRDPSGAVVTKASVTVTNEATNVVVKSQTTGAGVYVVPALPPGVYRIVVEHLGFKQIEVEHLELHTQDIISRNFMLPVGAASETIQVEGNQHTTDDSPAVSMTVTREFVENMPLNGRSFQDLIQLAPGAVDAQANGSTTGYYSFNGQRSDSNNYTVDGVSANLGGIINSGGFGSQGTEIGGAAPAQTAMATTQSLVSVDSLEEFRIQTSSYSAEFGRSPGGQIQLTTRPGTNELHGTLSEYFRNTALDAAPWNDGYFNQPKSAEHQNDFGGTLGGPLSIPKIYDGKNKSFYFLSYEGLRLLLPNFESEYVPTKALRSWASPNAAPFLDDAPLPSPTASVSNGECTAPDPLTTGQPDACEFNYSYSYPNNLDNYSVRVDQTFGKRFHAFARYSDTPSSSIMGLEQTTASVVNVHGWTSGLTTIISPDLVDDLRFNYSHDGEQSVINQRAFAGSVPFPVNLLVPPAGMSAYSLPVARLSVPNTMLSQNHSYGGTGTLQHQYQITNSLVWTRGRHSIKSGIDWRRLTPVWDQQPYVSNALINSINPGIQNGLAASLAVSASAPGEPVFDNVSLYIQDHWKVIPNLSIDYGLRWDFNPPPGPANGHYPVALTSSNLALAKLAPVGTNPYQTNYHSFGPRFGFAWNAIPSGGHALTVRGGFGIFFDTAQQRIAVAYARSYPFSVSAPTQTNLTLPFTAVELVPPSLNFPLTTPYPFLNGVSSPDLTAPYTEQWNLSLDEALTQKNTLTITYVGNVGKKILTTYDYAKVSGNSNFTSVDLTNNDGYSNYNALQIQDVGRIARGTDIVSSFAWTHALDNGSNDSGNGLPSPLYGNSDYDLRRTFNLALNY